MRSLKILILEPNPFQLMALHQMLNAIGIYDVLTAPSLASALCSLGHRGAVDIAICDPQLKGGDGLALIHHLAQQDQARALILLGAVASSVLGDLERLLCEHRLRMLGCLQTPVSAVLMRGLLDSYLLAPMAARA
ncbi:MULTISPECIES: response regulator [Pseudomonas]|uniref:Response regulator n=1 Tax=Pseudomonas monsensis TaxID=2745509 RepID=A0ABT3YSY8_9PSED|nr:MULTISPECIES: response regulator [Pseudomonas]PTT70898.1 DNA-binding protein [Pseudomonas sp. HMWF007]PTT80175.1 DNA-binding protein [Pseudomonas sp. HMWF005]MCY0108596.1 response regulator [Pseudomonas monsensis]PTS97709.1 DNA-binding protein [Pseudomonas sp. HMWF006]QXI01592.1 response regulator [Pseudomonas monsensis]